MLCQCFVIEQVFVNFVILLQPLLVSLGRGESVVSLCKRQEIAGEQVLDARAVGVAEVEERHNVVADVLAERAIILKLKPITCGAPILMEYIASVSAI